MRKRLMILGGTIFTIPAVLAAKELGIYTITCDYIPHNIAHKYSDEYCNVSVINKEAVLYAAKKLSIDGIISFACDAGAISAAYVQEKLGLPSMGPYESVCILQNKDRFRKFLRENGFNSPWSIGVNSIDDLEKYVSKITYPCIVKPIDGAGSKGVSRVDKPSELQSAVIMATEKSLSGRVIIEQFIEKIGFSSDSDCFSVNGHFKIITFSSQYFDDNAVGLYTPAAFSWPTTMGKKAQEELSLELQRLITLLNMSTSIYNVESCVGRDGKCYLMEVSPRGGGNRLAEIIKMGSGVDMIKANILSAVGLPIEDFCQSEMKGNWAEVIIHADDSGVFKGVSIDNEKYGATIIDLELLVKAGDNVEAFRSGSNALGTLIVTFNSPDNLSIAMSNISDWVKVIIE